jgi:hypothetical protein
VLDYLLSPKRSALLRKDDSIFVVTSLLYLLKKAGCGHLLNASVRQPNVACFLVHRFRPRDRVVGSERNNAGKKCVVDGDIPVAGQKHVGLSPDKSHGG